MRNYQQQTGNAWFIFHFTFIFHFIHNKWRTNIIYTIFFLLYDNFFHLNLFLIHSLNRHPPLILSWISILLIEWRRKIKYSWKKTFYLLLTTSCFHWWTTNFITRRERVREKKIMIFMTPMTMFKDCIMFWALTSI